MRYKGLYGKTNVLDSYGLRALLKLRAACNSDFIAFSGNIEYWQGGVEHGWMGHFKNLQQ